MYKNRSAYLATPPPSMYILGAKLICLWFYCCVLYGPLVDWDVQVLRMSQKIRYLNNSKTTSQQNYK
jgi:hypothetical protein